MATEVVVIGMPRTEFAARGGASRQAPLVAPEPLVRLLTTFVDRAGRDQHLYSAVDALRVGTLVKDMVGLLVASSGGTAPMLGPESHRALLLAKAKKFIDDNLGDPSLSPAVVAAANHVGERSLYRAFAAEGITVSRWIRDRRLSACRRDLMDPLHRGSAASRIGARWGFMSPTQFSRAFSQAYGLPPETFRQQILAGFGKTLAAGGNDSQPSRAHPRLDAGQA